MPVIINRSEPSNGSPNGSKTRPVSKMASPSDGSAQRRPGLLSGLNRSTQILAVSILLVIAVVTLSWSLGLFSGKPAVTASNMIESPDDTATQSGVGADSGGAASDPGARKQKQNDSKGD